MVVEVGQRGYNIKARKPEENKSCKKKRERYCAVPPATITQTWGIY